MTVSSVAGVLIGLVYKRVERIILQRLSKRTSVGKRRIADGIAQQRKVIFTRYFFGDVYLCLASDYDKESVT